MPRSSWKPSFSCLSKELEIFLFGKAWELRKLSVLTVQEMYGLFYWSLRYLPNKSDESSLSLRRPILERLWLEFSHWFAYAMLTILSYYLILQDFDLCREITVLDFMDTKMATSSSSVTLEMLFSHYKSALCAGFCGSKRGHPRFGFQQWMREVQLRVNEAIWWDRTSGRQTDKLPSTF